MRGLTQRGNRTADKFPDRAARWRARREVVNRSSGGVLGRVARVELHKRADQLSGALTLSAIGTGIALPPGLQCRTAYGHAIGRDKPVISEKFFSLFLVARKIKISLNESLDF
jgi:hypothetical protein